MKYNGKSRNKKKRMNRKSTKENFMCKPEMLA